MDDAGLMSLHAAALRYARWKAVDDPAIEPEDVVQTAWLKVLPILAGTPEDNRVGLLKWGCKMAKLDLYRRAKLRRHEPLDDWQPSPQRAEDEAIARLELRPIVERAVVGDPASVALVALGMGYTWPDVKRGLGVSQRRLHAWHCARGGLVA